MLWSVESSWVWRRPVRAGRCATFAVGCGVGTSAESVTPQDGRGGLRRPERRGQQPELLGRAGPRLPPRAPRHQRRRHRPQLERRRPQGRGDGRARAGPRTSPRSARTPTTRRGASSTPPTNCSPYPCRPTSSPRSPTRARSSGCSTACRSSPARGCCSTTRRSSPRPASTRASLRGPGSELARAASRLKASGVKIPVRAAARSRGGAGRDPDVDAQRRRLVHRQGRQLRRRLRRQRQDVQLAAGQPRRRAADRTAPPAAPTGRTPSTRSRAARSACSTATPSLMQTGRAARREVRHRRAARQSRAPPAARWASPTGSSPSRRTASANRSGTSSTSSSATRTYYAFADRTTCCRSPRRPTSAWRRNPGTSRCGASRTSSPVRSSTPWASVAGRGSARTSRRRSATWSGRTRTRRTCSARSSGMPRRRSRRRGDCRRPALGWPDE